MGPALMILINGVTLSR